MQNKKIMHPITPLKYIDGTYGLAITFWSAILLSLFVRAIINYNIAFAVEYYSISVVITSILSSFFYLSIWNASSKKNYLGLKIWSISAKIFVLIGIIITIGLLNNIRHVNNYLTVYGIEKKTKKGLTRREILRLLKRPELLEETGGIVVEPSQEELMKKLTDYYKSASDQEIDKFIIQLTNAEKKVLPHKLNKAMTLYNIKYVKDKNHVFYAYEVNAGNLGLTEQELIANKKTVTYNTREYHKKFFCSLPSSRMELDIGIGFLINILSTNSQYVGSYKISKGDCIN